MRNLDFIPFGAQYYRAPTPKPHCWERDIKNFAGFGFNTLKIWAQWRWNNPKKDVYDFSDLHTIMDLAKKYGVKVIINMILDVMPVWFYQEYPDSVMVMNSGEPLRPQATPYRQIGGAPGPCYNHPAAKACKNKFVSALAREFADHPALLMWDLWNEPELTCGIKREPSVPALVCYCDHCRAAFIAWLQDKYRSVENLNEAWGKNYSAFSDIELPRSPLVFQDMIDWRTFYTYVLRDDLRDRASLVRAEDTHHPVMIHTVPSPYFNMVNSCCDDYLMAKECDLFGNSIGSDPFPAALSVCSAKGKEVLNAEIHAMGGTTFHRPADLTYDQIKRHIFTPFSMGVKGYLFWQYRPETLGLESPAWGMVDLEGNPTACTAFCRRVNDIFVRERELMVAARPVQSRIAVIKDNYNEIFDWCVEQSLKRAHNSLLGAFNAFYRAGYNVDVLTSDQLLEEELTGYKLIYYPFPYYMQKKVADRLKEWTRAGGTFVSEALFGAYRAEDGVHSEKCPGYGFDEVFSASETHVLCASQFKNAYGESWSESNRDQELTNLHFELDGSTYDIKGYFFEETLQPGENACTIARFDSGAVAAVKSTYGGGKALFLGSMIGYAYQMTEQKETCALFGHLAEAAGVEKEIHSDAEGLRCDILTAGGRAVVILDNARGKTCRARVGLSRQYRFDTAQDADNGEIYPISDRTFVLDLEAGAVRILLLSENNLEHR